MDVQALYVLERCLLAAIWDRVGRSRRGEPVLWSFPLQTQQLALGVGPHVGAPAGPLRDRAPLLACTAPLRKQGPVTAVPLLAKRLLERAHVSPWKSYGRARIVVSMDVGGGD